ncbi:MAG: putative baseplate assembly protein [Gemmatimonadetes bacterium]|nr:putative baseplate assembly protein [Gemmatimonadota bacterium]
MSLAPPPLEARTFDELLAEARRRIARYTPEYTLGWTDHNESDPGMVLVQLFAWLAQITQERVNKLPERAYRSLLHLLNLRVRPATPATADLVFEAVPGVAGSIHANKATRVGAPPAPDGSPIVFETTAALDIISADLAYVLTYDGTTFRDVTALNEPAGGSIRPFGERPENGAAIYFGFAVPSSTEAAWRPFPGRISLRAFEPEALEAPSPIACGEAPQVTRAEMDWQYLPGEGEAWENLTIYEDETRALEVGGYLALEGPREIKSSPLWTVAEPHYWLRLRIRNPDYGSRVPEVAFFRFNAVRARHEVTQNDELLGVSDGSPDQVVSVRWAPIVPGSLELTVQDESGQPQPWNEVELFRADDPGAADDPAAGPDAQVYRLDAETGEIHFGDGYSAAIPPAGSEIVARTYRYGGGSAGNVEAEQITSLQATLPGVSGATNPRPAIGGLDAETVEQALRNAPQWLRRRERVVTARDFENAALTVGGVAKAAALPGRHPDYPGVRVPGAVTVLIVQDTDREPPTPTETLLRRVCDELDAQRTLTTEVYVRSPVFVKIDVEADLLVDPTKSMSNAENEARDQIRAYLSYRNWRFGQDLYPANLQSQLLSLPTDVGIWAVEGLRIHVDGQLHTSPTEPCKLGEDALPYAGRIDLSAAPYTEE